MSRNNHSTLTVAGVENSHGKWLEYAWEAISCWLLAFGTAVLQNHQLMYPVSIVSLLWQTLVTVVILSAVTRRWYVTVLAAIEAAAIGLGLTYILNWDTKMIWEKGTTFIRWWFFGQSITSDYYTQKDMIVLHAVFTVAIACLLYFVVRISRGSLPPLLLCAGFFLGTLAFGEPDDILLAAAAYIAGVFPLIARSQYSGRVMFTKKERFRPMGNRGAVPAIAGILCVLVVGTMLLVLPSDTNALRNRACADMTADFQSVSRLYTNDQRNLDSPTLRDFGLQPYRNRLGGTLKEPEHQVLGTTDIGEQTTLRVTSYDLYDGKMWSKSFSNAYRMNGLFSTKQKQMIGSPALTDRYQRVVGAMSANRTFHITLTQDSVFLPMPSLTYSFTENVSTANPVLYNASGEVFSSFGFEKGYDYTVTEILYPFDSDELHYEDFGLFNTAAINTKDTFYNNKSALEPFLQLPEDYSEKAKAIAAELAADFNFPTQQAVTICHYFSKENGFIYAEKTGRVESDENVVDLLLEEKKGYCVYYATAMATMCRSLGIPSRLAAGYRTVPSTSYTGYVIDAASPYVWVECYFRGFGWVAFDPSPEARRIKILDEEEKKDDKPEETDDPMPDEEPTPIYWENPTPVSPWPWIIAIALIILLIALRTLLIPHFHSLKAIRKRYPLSAQQAEFYYRDILRQLRLIGIRRTGGETLAEMVARLDLRTDPELAELLPAALAPIPAMHFGGLFCTPEEAEALADTHARLESLVKRRKNKFVYFLRRRLLCPLLCPQTARYTKMAEITQRSAAGKE